MNEENLFINFKNGESTNQKINKITDVVNWLCHEMQHGRVNNNNISLKKDITNVSTPLSIAFVTLAEQGEIDEATASEHTEMFLAWQTSMQCKTGMFLQHEGRLYRVLQDHTSQADWLPENTPALYKVVGINENGIPEYSRPISSKDAYMAGDEMMFKNVHYRSKIDYNVWTPEEYPESWEVIE